MGGVRSRDVVAESVSETLPTGTAAHPRAARGEARAWSLLTLLFAANAFNFFDRSIPGVLGETIRHEFELSDFQLGELATTFSLVFAVAGIPLAWLADTRSRRAVIVAGLGLWTLATGLTGLAWNFPSLAVLRIAVGIGEASFGPAVVSVIADLFAVEKRSRAVALYMLGLPVGLLLSYGLVGPIAHAFGSWRAAFVVSAVPGLFLAVAIWLTVREPARNAATMRRDAGTAEAQGGPPIWRVLRTPTLWWTIGSGATLNIAIYATFSFITPTLQRVYGVSLNTAGAYSAVMIGATGIIGLGAGGWVSDRIHRRHRNGRLPFGAGCMALAGAATAYALSRDATAITPFVIAYAIGWLLQYQYYTCVYPVLQSIAEPRHRSRVTAVYFACSYCLGGAFGPTIVGHLSDRFAVDAMVAAGASTMGEAFKASGLHDAMYVVPLALTASAAFLLLATSTFSRDAARAASDAR